jgi:hypothetical protein
LPISRREFIKLGAATAIGVNVASAIEIPLLARCLVETVWKFIAGLRVRSF